MKKFIGILLIFIPAILSSTLTEHQEPFTGTRALGMGSAFIAVSDDSSAVSYNPAGLSQIKYSQIGWMYSPAYMPGFFKSYANFVYPLARFHVIGIDWNHVGYQDKEIGSYGVPELTYSEGKVNAGYGTRLYEKLFIGATLKVIYMSAEFDGESEGKGTGYNLNLGLLYALTTKFKIGLVGFNLLPSFNDTKKWGMTIRYEDGVENVKYEPSLRAGISYVPIKNLTLALDGIDPVCFGSEYWLFNLFGIRGGIKYSKLNTQLGFSGGASVRYWLGQLDYALNYNSGLDIVHNFGLSVVWGYQAYLVEVVNVDIDSVFPSIYKTYATKDVLRIKLKNKSQTPLEAKIGFEAEKIMKAPTEKKVILKPGLLTEVSMPVIFSEDITETKDDSVVTGNVFVAYRVEERESKDINSQKFTLYGRNALVWDDMDKIASFVTPQDETIIEFTRNILQNYKTSGNYIVSKNFHRAMLVFEALGVIGITYVPDPSNPFNVSKEVIDYIQYPKETLKIKTGDCDDCTVLFTSCLESIGIRTAAIITPDHIFMMFDSGVLPEEVNNVFKDQELYIILDGIVWIPVETTMYGKSFFNAIKEGITTCQKALQSEIPNSIVVVDIETAWGKYPSSPIKVKDFTLAPLSDKSMKTILYNNAVYYIGIKEGENFSELIEQLKNNNKDPNLFNQAGKYFGMYGMFDISKYYFQEASRLKPDWASPYNNLGNLYLLIGENDKAIKEYETALKLSPNDPSIIENIEFVKKLKNK